MTILIRRNNERYPNVGEGYPAVVVLIDTTVTAAENIVEGLNSGFPEGLYYIEAVEK